MGSPPSILPQCFFVERLRFHKCISTLSSSSLFCPLSFPLFHLFPFLSRSNTHFPSLSSSPSLFSIPFSFPLPSDQCKNRTGEALSPLPARWLISIFMRGTINYTWDPEGKQRQENETWTHILALSLTHTRIHAHMQVCSHMHTYRHVLTFSSSHTLSQSHMQKESCRQVIGEKECAVQYLGSVQGRRHTQYWKGEVEVTLSQTGNAVHTQAQCSGWLFFSTLEGKRV